jgi:hypothetical protein
VGQLLVVNGSVAAVSTVSPAAPATAPPTFVVLGQVGFTATFDGGDGCYGFNSIGATFDIDTPTTAEYEASGIRFTSTWSSNYSSVTITDTFHTCASRAFRTNASLHHSSNKNAVGSDHVSWLVYLLAVVSPVALVIHQNRILSLEGDQ